MQIGLWENLRDGRAEQIRQMGPKTWGIIIVAFIAVYLVAGQLGYLAGADRARESRVPKAPDFIANGGTEPSDGLNEGMMDQAMLARFEKLTLDDQLSRTRRILESHGERWSPLVATSSSSYVTSGGHKLAIARLFVKERPDSETGVYMVHILGVFGNEIRRVACASKAVKVDLSQGRCADKIEEVFGSRLNGQ